MTPKIFFIALRTAIQNMLWSDTGSKIFGASVYLVPDIPMQQIARLQSPTCFIVDEGGVQDGAHPNIIDQKFTLGFFVENVQSEFGESTLCGASGSKGLLDIENEVISQLCKTISLTANKIMLIEKGKVRTGVIDRNFPMTMRLWQFEILLGIF